MPRWALSRQATWFLAAAALLLVLVGIGARWQLRTAWEASDEVMRTQKVLATGNSLFGRLSDIESAQRGYLLTNRPDYLEFYTAGREGAISDLRRLRPLLRDDPEQHRRLQSVTVLATAKLDEMQRTIDLRQSQGLEAALEVVSSDLGRQTMDRLRTVLGEINASEQAALGEQLTVRAVERRRLGSLLFAGSIGALGLMLIGVVALNAGAISRLAAERRLRESEARLRITLRSIGDAVIATDPHGRIVFMNESAQQLTAWSERDAIDQPLETVFRIVHADTRATVESPVAKVLRDGQIVGLADHTILVGRDGTERPIDHSGAPIRDADSGIMGVVLVFRDVTDRLAMEREREARDAAESRAAVAMAARAAAESANRAKDQFLAVLSHELRSPLNAIVGWLAMLRRGLEGAQLTRALDTIERNVHVQSKLINDLLDVSRIVSGKLSLDEEPIDLAAVLQMAIDATRPAAAAKAVRLVTTAEPLAGSVRGDARRLQQVVMNLLNNALKFTPGGGRVEVKLWQRDTLACVDVIDTGVGIAPEFLPHVFDRFRQADESDARAHGGLGLGLSIVKHLIERHGGTVEALSDGIGRGATFRLCLPLIGSEPIAPLPDVPAETAPGDLRGIAVLVVDDDADTREGMCLALEVNGARVTPADSASAALAALARERPNALVSDIGMPGGTGLHLIRAVREQFGPLPAIAISGYASREDREAALAAGFNDHLPKPVDPGTLLARLRQLVDQRG